MDRAAWRLGATCADELERPDEPQMRPPPADWTTEQQYRATEVMEDMRVFGQRS